VDLEKKIDLCWTRFLRQILEKKWKYNRTGHQLLIDFKKAYMTLSNGKTYTTI